MSLVKHKFRLKDGTQVESKDWYYRFTMNGKTHFASTKTTNKQLAARVEKKKRDELVAQYELGQSQGVTVEKAISNWLATVKNTSQFINHSTNARKLMGSKRDTRTGGKSEEYVEVFGFDKDRVFHTLNDGDVQSLIVGRRDEGVAPATILNELSALSGAIQVNANLKHPVPNISFAGLKKLNGLKQKKTKLRYLSSQEEADFLRELHPDTVVHSQGFMKREEILEQRQAAYDLAITLLDLGCRYSEAAKLPVKAVNLKDRTIEFFRNKVQNESVILMTNRLYEVMARRLAGIPKTQRHVFTAKDGGPRKYSPRAFKSALRRAGVENATIKTIRKTFASRLVKAGVPLYDVSKLLGHASVTTTANHYAHLAPNEASIKAVQVLNSLNEVQG